MKRLAVLGSTGSIGVNTLDIAGTFKNEFEVVALSAGTNIQLLREQIERFEPKVVSVMNEALAKALKREISPRKTEVFFGVEGLILIATIPEIDLVVSALVGAAGLIPTISAIKARKSIALANKESLVMAGKIIVEEARKNGITILPVDSEHSAIFQVLAGRPKDEVKRIILTASGGPFLNLPHEKMEEVTSKEALHHPTWNMGRKVSIDSASLMNKGLEVIEAHWLFGVATEQIVVHIHPQSVVHSMVEYVDGSIVAQMGITDMRIPICYALSYPKRLPLYLPPLDLFHMDGLTFLPPDMDRFPCLRLAYRSMVVGETMPAVLNAANEVAVNSFMEETIKFTDIPKVVEKVMEDHEIKPLTTLDDALRADQWARERTKKFIEEIRV
ncbi:MAG: 1-deoxy-D-xylulose-5-phosphate reductoisomerase [Syntrophobacterales bacterium]|nr:MAG: 1-deoxy-D-xylulose-5-phosphate reductoisomerase [Syntrophobacterales bacterium]